MKSTILSVKQADLLDSLVAKYGLIVTSGQIFELARTNWDYKQAKNLVTKLTKDGWLIRIKRGLYAISDLSGRGFLALSNYEVANLLVKDSYVSLESALQYHNMLDQLMSETISVGLKAYSASRLNNMKYGFIKTKSNLYFGFEEININGKAVKIATAEKALIDIINFRRSKLSIDLVFEKIISHRNNLDFKKLAEFLAEFSDTTIKIFGLIFDFLNIDSSELQNLIKVKHSTHRMLSGNKKFNAKWRLYYDEYFDRYDYKLLTK